MNLILEITKPDGSVVIQPVNENLTKVDTNPGEQFRLLDSTTGLPPADISAFRDGENLVIQGIPEMSALELCDFYKHDGEGACVFSLPGEQVVAPTTAPVMLAQSSTAKPEVVKKDAATAADKEAASSDAAAASSGDAAAAAAANPAFSTSTIAIGGIAAVGIAAGLASDSDSPAPAPAPGPGPTPPPAPTPGPTPPPAPTGVTSEGADDTIGVRERLPAASGGNPGETGSIDFVGAAGSAEAGATVTLDLNNSGGNSVISAPVTTSAAADGSFTVSVTPADALALTSGVYTPVITQTTADGTSAAATVNDITVLPTSPSSVGIEGGDTTVSLAEAAGGVDITGTTEANASVQVIMWDTGFTTQQATANATADGSGNFTATFAEADLPADGTYTLQTTTTTAAGASDFPNTSPIILDRGAAAGSTVTAGAATVLNGSAAGGEALIGDYGGVPRNGSFEFWDTSAVITQWDAAGFTANGGDSANLGWTLAPGATALDPDSTPGLAAPGGGGTQDYFNHSAGAGAPPGDPADRRVQFDTGSTVGTGLQDWDTVSNNFYAGGGLTQDVPTMAGAVYTLQIRADDATGNPAGANPQDTMIQVSWDGTVIAERQPDGTWTGSNPPTIDTTPANEVNWDFTLPATTSGSTTLTIAAFDRHFDGAGGGAGDGGDDQGVIITNISMGHSGTANDDTISGDAGADLIWGQGGNDTLYGGTMAANDTDADQFIYSMQMDNGNDMIMDFDAANGDRVQLIDVVNAAGAPTAQADSASYDSALDFNDLIVTGTQEITVTASGDGDVLLTFLNGGTGIGSVELNNVTFGTGAGQYDTVQDLTTGGGSNIILEMTGDGFHTGL